ncbi:TPA: hypothetical protein ACLZEB_001207 [Streptococcus pneumoniae]|uniref:hypothetical protein n=1 Tax=Lysinibacillus sp. 1 U-2021 TaxID=3039426 RepID=UPI0024809180|nr:hypothetical protein [Lysinibacillus sp. 1 U-2021]WGT40107.1 hypothetical protein QH639_04820 [Lysinibacillus sp. 1 U-2021]
MSISVRDRVLISDLNNKVIGKGMVINYNIFREPGMEYAVVFDGDVEVYFVGENQLEKLYVEAN